MRKPYITTQKDLRAAFWRENTSLSRKRIPSHDGRGRMYTATTRTAWCQWIDSLARAGVISESLASRACLD